jgi:penicillin amidase
MEWLGIRPLEEIPQELNPPQGIVINWNNQSAAGHGAHGNWSVVDRVNEITARLNAKERFSRDEVWDLNRDLSFADLNARYFIPFIEEAAAELESDDPVLQAVRMLSDWNMLNTDPGSSGEYVEPAGTIMREWLPLIYERVLLDDLPTGVVSISAGYPTQDSGASIPPGGGSKLLYNALLDDSAGVTQTFDFFNGADATDRLAILIEVLREAVDRLTAKFGSDTSTWLTPVAAHTFRDRNFLGIPSASPGATFELPTYMNRGTQNHQVIFGEEGVSMCSVAPPGQSGFVAPDGTRAQHYMDQLQLYQDFSCKRDWLTESALDENLESVVTLSVEH